MENLKLDLLALRERWRKNPNYACLWSSPDNPKGFGLTPQIEVGRLYADMTIERHHSGFPGIAQGGVAFTILDGLMSWYVMAHFGRAGFTKQSSVRYRKPLRVGERYRFEVMALAEAKIPTLTGRVYHVSGEGAAATSPLLEMTAEFFLPSRALAEQVLGIVFGPDEQEIFPDE